MLQWWNVMVPIYSICRVLKVCGVVRTGRALLQETMIIFKQAQVSTAHTCQSCRGVHDHVQFQVIGGKTSMLNTLALQTAVMESRLGSKRANSAAISRGFAHHNPMLDSWPMWCLVPGRSCLLAAWHALLSGLRGCH